MVSRKYDLNLAPFPGHFPVGKASGNEYFGVSVKWRLFPIVGIHKSLTAYGFPIVSGNFPIGSGNFLPTL
jgi:hypothetical protein